MQKFLITILFTLFLSFTANAENHLHEDKLSPEDSDVETFNFYWTQMPTVCAPREDIAAWLIKHEFTPVSVSFGKENGIQENRVVYAITLYINPTYQMAAIAETQNSPDKCVLFRTFDLQLNPNLVQPGLTL